MENSIDQSRIYRLRNVTLSVRIFEYGGGYRVQYVKVSNSKDDSKCLDHFDHYFEIYNHAASKFAKLNALCEGIWICHWNNTARL